MLHQYYLVKKTLKSDHVEPGFMLVLPRIKGIT